MKSQPQFPLETKRERELSDFLPIFMLLLIFFLFQAFAPNQLKANSVQHTIYLISPANDSYTNQNNNTLQFIYNHTGYLTGMVNCTLYLDGIPVNYSVNVPPNQNIAVYSNQTISEGRHWWWVNCTNGTAYESSVDYGYNFTFIAEYTPTIQNVRNATPMATTVHILWNLTHSNWNNRVKYSTDPTFTTFQWSSWHNNTREVDIKLWNLEPNTTYYYQVYSYNPENESYYSNSSIYNFTTPECVSYRFVSPDNASLTGIDHPIQEAIDMICPSGGIVHLSSGVYTINNTCLLYTSPSPRDRG